MTREWTYDELMAQVVTPSFERMFKPDELSKFRFELRQGPRESRVFSREGGWVPVTYLGVWRLELIDGASRTGISLVQPWAEETEDEIRERLRSDLQDFIAESSFAWGQFRPV